MKRSLFVLGAAALFGTAVLASASAQEAPLCGPPGGEVPATIVGAGTIIGTPGDDVIVGGNGLGIVEVSNGGQVISLDTIIGNGAATDSRITVSGDLSRWQITGALTVGNSGSSRGTLRVETRGGTLEVQAGQAVHAPRGEWVRYSTPEGAEYLAVCIPAFSLDTVHRDG